MSTNKSIVKSAGVIGFGTCLSRILGFIRDVLIANFFGTGLYTQAFIVAFRIPNLSRDLIGEGAANAAFVPVLSEYRSKKSSKEFWELANTLLNVMVLILLIITILGIIFAPYIVRIIAPGFIGEPAKLNITIRLTRIMFPYIFLIGLSAYSMGILHSLKSFLVPALGYSMLNISVILTLLFLAPILEERVLALAVGVLIGGVLQVGIQIPVLKKKGMVIKRKIKFYHSQIKRIVKLLFPRIIGSCIYQINILVDTVLASLAFIVGSGGIAALYFANRVTQFPLAIFGISLAQAVLPTFSIQALEKNLNKFKDTLSFSLRNIFFITIPASVGLIVLRRPIISTLFERGEFCFESTQITSYALLFYAIGLFAYAGIKILVSGFYSMNDTATPVKIAGMSLIINITLNLILMWPLKIGGLALATSISAIFNFIMLFVILRKKIGHLHEKRIFYSFLKIMFCAVIMGFGCLLIYTALTSALLEISMLGKIITLFIPIISGVIIYIALCFVFKVDEIKLLYRWIYEKRQKKTGKII